MNRTQMIGPPLAVATIVILALAAISIISKLQSPSPLVGSGSDRPSPLAGKRAPDWGGGAWIRSGPLSWEMLRGRTVIVHLPAGPALDSVAVSALADFVERWSARGLTVIAILGADPAAGDGSAAGPAAMAPFPAVLDTMGALRRSYGLADAHDARTVTVDRDGVVRSVLAGGIGGAPGEARTRLATLAEIELAVESLLGRGPAAR